MLSKDFQKLETSRNIVKEKEKALEAAQQRQQEANAALAEKVARQQQLLNEAKALFN